MHTSPNFFSFNDTPTTEIYTLSLHDALPISERRTAPRNPRRTARRRGAPRRRAVRRSEEHTSELQSPDHLVCRLLLEKKKTRSGRALLAPHGNDRGQVAVPTKHHPPERSPAQ